MMMVDKRGFTTNEASRISGASARQIDYWLRTGLVPDGSRDRTGSGHYRRWSRDDIVLLTVLARLRGCGVALSMLESAAATVTNDPNVDTLDVLTFDPAISVEVDVAAIRDEVTVRMGRC
jgi:DNA-binding transcriptional MerR regulator